MVFSVAAIAQPTVVNHSFEEEYWTGAWEDHWPGYFTALGTPPGWSYEGGCGIAHADDGGFGLESGGAPHGFYFAFIQSTGTLRQDIAGWEEGGMYKIKLNARARANTDPVNFEIRLGSDVLYSAQDFDPYGFVEITVPVFVYSAAQGSQLEISSESATGGDAALLFDNVRIEEIKPPALLDSGAGGVGDSEPFLDFTLVFDAPAGEDRLLVVTTGARDNSGNPEKILPASVSCDIGGAGAVPMTKARERISPDWDTGRAGASLWFLPIGGSATAQSASVTVTFADTDNAGGVVGWAVVENIDQIKPRGTVPKSNTSGGVTAAHTSGDVTAAPAEWIVIGADTCRDGLAVLSVGTGQNLLYETTQPPENIMHASICRVVETEPVETVNLQITADADSPWAMVGAAFKGVTAADGLGGGEIGSSFALHYEGLNPTVAAQGYRVELTVAPQNNNGLVTYQWYRVSSGKSL